MKLKIIKTTTIISTLLCTALLCGCNPAGTFKVGGMRLYTGAVLSGLGILDPDANWKKKKEDRKQSETFFGQKRGPNWFPMKVDEEVLAIQEGPPVVLIFDEVPIGETFGFIAHTTGKKVVVDGDENLILEKKITLLNDEPIGRRMVVDLLFKEFKLKQVGVDELEDTIVLSSLE